MPKVSDPPLIDVKVTNPVTYFKKWWAKIIGNEGIDFRLHFHPLTAIAIALAIASVGFGVGRFVLPVSIPFFKYQDTIPSPLPTSTPEPLLKDTAFVGTLQYSNQTAKFYLVTTSSEAITLIVPSAINLSGLAGKRILAVGSYNKSSRTLQVSDAKNLEILPKTPLPVPTTTPLPHETSGEVGPSPSPKTLL